VIDEHKLNGIGKLFHNKLPLYLIHLVHNTYRVQIVYFLFGSNAGFFF